MKVLWIINVIICTISFSPLLIFGQDLHTHNDSEIGYFLNPETGNLLIGREDQLFTTSTCGEEEIERYCVFKGESEGTLCFRCNSQTAETQNGCKPYNIKNVVPEISDRCESWWQSEKSVSNVSIKFDLESEFALHNISINFKTSRPKGMLIEKSKDFGKTWRVLQYFAEDCENEFPGLPIGPRQSIFNVTCDQRYSALHPLEFGEVHFQIFPGDIHPNTFEALNYQKFTNLRINLTHIHETGATNTKYYAIQSMDIQGSCYCYGHASRCVISSSESEHPGKIHSQCICSHHTEGMNCEMCEDLFNDRMWSPGNSCKKCECNNHTTSCHFDNAIYEVSQKVTGGVCNACADNTAGIHCSNCKNFFYENPLATVKDDNFCLECDCNPMGSLSEYCEPRNVPNSDIVAGQCSCRHGARGLKCDEM